MPIPFLPSLIAAFTLANGAHYWHQQLKPFANEQERFHALKQELAESTFTAHWNEEDKKDILRNPDFLKFELHLPGQYAVTTQVNNSKYYRLFIGWDSPLITSKNRCALKNECKKRSGILGHEGAHVAQGMEKIHNEPENKNYFEFDADLQGLNATLDSNTLSSSEKLYAILSDKAFFTNNCQKNHKQGPQDKSPCPYQGPYPPCLERILLRELYIRQARMEIINETVREEIAWQ